MAWESGVIPMRENPQVAIVGAGPAGLSAAAVLARCGARVTAYDENDRPGGQLFKQIHKFFGSGHHGAGVRGVELGCQLLAECEAAGVEICLSHTVYGIFPGGRLGVTHAGYSRIIRAEKILIATGATEKALAFPGWVQRCGGGHESVSSVDPLALGLFAACAGRCPVT